MLKLNYSPLSALHNIHFYWSQAIKFLINIQIKTILGTYKYTLLAILQTNSSTKQEVHGQR